MPKAGGATDFTGVQTTFIVPAVTCTAQNATATTRTGMDGITDSTAEIVGVNEACVNAVPFYTAFYRMFPVPMVNEFHPSAGDKVSAVVTRNASVYTLSFTTSHPGRASPPSRSAACARVPRPG